MASTTAEGEPAPPLVLRYKAKKVWPPDFTLLSPQEQLRFEKRYKRRVAIRGERPRWIKFVKLAQLVCITRASLSLADSPKGEARIAANRQSS